MRPAKLDYYLAIAKVVATRGTCIRRNFGAVIVKGDSIISTGYSGAPRGKVNCCDTMTCQREELGCKPGERYELCRSVHAEQNAIIAVGRKETTGSTLYLYGFEVKTNKSVSYDPCLLCKKMIINAGIEKVFVFPNRELIVVDWDI